MVGRERRIGRSAEARDRGQGRVHRRGTAHRDEAEAADARQERRGQKGRHFPQDVGQQRDRGPARAERLPDEDAGERIIGEARTDGEALRERFSRQEEAHGRHARQTAANRTERQEPIAFGLSFELGEQPFRQADLQPHEENQHEEDVAADEVAAAPHAFRQPSEVCEQQTGHETTQDDEAAAQAFPKRFFWV